MAIDWARTYLLFNTDELTTKSKMKVAVYCDKCRKESTTRRDNHTSSMNKKGAFWCHQCAINEARENGKYIRTAEQTEAARQRTRELWQNPEFRSKVVEISKIAPQSREMRKEASDRAKRQWESQEFRNAVSAGVEAAMARPDVKRKVKDGLKRRWQNDDYRKKIAAVIEKQPRISSLQSALYDYLDDLNVEYIKEGEGTVVGCYVFDCLIPKRGKMSKSLLIECHGEYWHNLAKNARNDRSKFTYIDRYHPEYEIMYVWEHEFIANGRVLDRLKIKLGIELQVHDFDFKSVTVRPIDFGIANVFLRNYHYLKGGKGGTHFGAYIENKLIAVITYAHPVRQNIASAIGVEKVIELARMCIHPSYHKKNFSSWLISRTIKSFEVPVVAFSDKTLGHDGTIYKASNFELHHEAESDYWYIDEDGYEMHKRTLYRHAVSLKKTEAEYAIEHKFMKQWGGPKLCFVYMPRK